MLFDKNILRQRIAASKLYKYLPNIYIQSSNNKYYDLLISNRSEGFIFGAKVGSTKMLKSNEFNQYVQMLSHSTLEEIKYPIVAISVNENSEDVKIGMLIRIRLQQPIIFANPKMVSINENNASILYDNIKSMDKVIRNLNNDNWGIIKRCGISQRGNDGFIANAYVMYLRPFSDDYKMREPEISNEKEEFKRYVYGIPQNAYPSDIIDQVILKGLTSLYRGAEISHDSSLLLFNTELDNLRRTIESYGNYKNIKLRFEPNIEDEIMKLGYFSSIPISLELYPENELINNIWHDEERIISLNSNQWRDFYDKYKSNPHLKTDISQILL